MLRIGGGAAVVTTVYTAVTGTENAAADLSTQMEDPQQARIRELEAENQHLKDTLKEKQNKTFFQRYFKCFGKQKVIAVS